MNSLVSETKVICNDTIPNPITPVPIKLLSSDDTAQPITVLNGAHIKIVKEKAIVNCDIKDGKEESSKGDVCKDDTASKEDNSMNTDISNELSNESSLSPSEPMDCNSTPNISPAHIAKCNGSNEDVAMSETVSCRLRKLIT